MWNTFLERGKELAEKAKQAAVQLDKQLDETVGIDERSSAGIEGLNLLPGLLRGDVLDGTTAATTTTSGPTLQPSGSGVDAILLGEDAWGDEDDLDLGFDDDNTKAADGHPDNHADLHDDAAWDDGQGGQDPIIDDLKPAAVVSPPTDPIAAPVPTDDDSSGGGGGSGAAVVVAPDRTLSPSPSAVSAEVGSEPGADDGEGDVGDPDPPEGRSLSVAAPDEVGTSPGSGDRPTEHAAGEDVGADHKHDDDNGLAQPSDVRNEEAAAPVELPPLAMPPPTKPLPTLPPSHLDERDSQHSHRPSDPGWAEESLTFDTQEDDDKAQAGTNDAPERPVSIGTDEEAAVPAADEHELNPDLRRDSTADMDGDPDPSGTTEEDLQDAILVDVEVDPPPDETSAPSATADVASESLLDLSPRSDGAGSTPALTEQIPPSPPSVQHSLTPPVPRSPSNLPQLGEVSPPLEDHDLVPSAPTLVSSTTHDEEEASRLRAELESQQEITRLLEQRLDEVAAQLGQREDQLVSKTQQLSMLQSDWETERADWQAKLQATKDEAKRRIVKAKERVDAAEAKLLATSHDDRQQAEVIAALRSEGERLAHKQAEMEKAVRAAKSESRELRERLEDEVHEKLDALERVQQLEGDLKATKDQLTAARRGESQADKLESDLSQAREDLERKGSTILALEQQLKEQKAEIKELIEELETAREGAAIDSQMQQEKLLKHHEDTVKDLEQKLHSTERDAAVREDALRHEVDELRKRWQDAVRRADALSMDIQSSTAPLMRQLESAERQNRVRAAAAAEIETKLRSELEETVIANEKLVKDNNELRTKFNRLERRAGEAEAELTIVKQSLEDKVSLVKQLEARIRTMESEGAKLKQEWAEVERLANEGVARVRSEMTQTVVESEERYRSQVDSLKTELSQEQDRRKELEAQLRGMLATAGTVSSTMVSQPLPVLPSKVQRLRKSEGQEQILAGALGLEGDDDDDDNDLDDDDDGENELNRGGLGRQTSESFAAIEELSSRLKAAKVEVSSLRRSLEESEKTRERLVVELGESRSAKEKLPLFEAKVQELATENQEQALEILGLREDIDEVRDLYRSQLNMLLEEKARLLKQSNGEVLERNGTTEAEVVPAEPVDASAETTVAEVDTKQ